MVESVASSVVAGLDLSSGEGGMWLLIPLGLLLAMPVIATVFLGVYKPYAGARDTSRSHGQPKPYVDTMDVRTWAQPTRLAIYRHEGLIWLLTALTLAVAFAVVLDAAGLFEAEVRRDRREFAYVVLLLTLIATPFLALPVVGVRRADLIVDVGAGQLRRFVPMAFVGGHRTWTLAEMSRAYEAQRCWSGHSADAVIVEFGRTRVLVRVRLGEGDRFASSLNALAGVDHEQVRQDTAAARRGLFF